MHQASEISKSYETLYNNKDISDFTLITADDEEIPVHKIILATRSEVFGRMMESQLKEGEAKKAKIDDISSTALKEFLRYLYCGRINNIDSIAAELIYAAEKYDLKDLKPLCVLSLMKTISVEGAVDTLILSDLHNELSLKQFALEYIVWKYDEVKKSESWKDVPTYLCKEILDCTVKRNQNYIVKLSNEIKAPQRTPQVRANPLVGQAQNNNNNNPQFRAVQINPRIAQGQAIPAVAVVQNPANNAQNEANNVQNPANNAQNQANNAQNEANNAQNPRLLPIRRLIINMEGLAIGNNP